MSRLAAVYISELRFGKFSHLKDGFPSCVTQSDPQDFGNVNFLCLGDINYQVLLEIRPLDLIGRLAAPFQL